MSKKELPTLNFKLVLLGDSYVGKSSLVLRFVRDEYSDYQESTIGAAFLTQTVPLDDCIVKFEIWDTAGQERYHSLTPMYYRGASAVLIVYDITSEESFQRAKNWVDELKAKPNDITIAFVGNKIDRDDQRTVETQIAASYSEANELLFCETSAKTGHNVSRLFETIAAELPAKKKKENEAFQLNELTPENENTRRCCR